MSKKLLLGALVLMLGMCVRVNAQLVTLLEDFEQGLPTTWTQDPASGVTAWTVSNSGLTGVTAYEGNNYASLFTTNQQVDTKLMTPLMDISSLTTPELSFFLVQKARGVNTGYARDTLRVYARTSVTAAWTLVETLSDEVATWGRQRIDLSSLANANLQLAFEFVYGSGLGLGIDNVRLGDATVCYTPNNLQAFRVTSTSAELMWTAYESAFEYGLKVSTTQLSDPAASTANVFDQTVYFKPYTISGLTPSTQYYFYVSANCGDGDVSAWSEAGTFTTACAPATLPYTDPMEANSTYSTCWSKVWEANGDWGTTTPAAGTYAPAINTTHHAGTQSVRLYGYYSNLSSYSSPRTIKSYVASHEMNTTDIRNQQVTFWGYGSTVNAKVHVGVMTDPKDFSTFEELTVIRVDAASTWKEYTIPFNTVTNAAAKHVCFMTDGADGTASFYFYIDDVLVEDIPLCPKPTMLTTGIVTHDHARVNWMGSSSAYNVKVSTTALSDPETATANVLTTTVTGNSINITGLSPRTTYHVYVQANCTAEGNGTSPWSNELQFTTTNIAAMPPYFCGFEDASENALWDLYNGTVPNQWAIGSAINHGGSNALYISPDNGATAQYNITGTSSVVAVRTILLPPGHHGISFDWQAGGESTIDYLRAELAPTTASFSAGTTAVGANMTPGYGGVLLSPVKMNLSNGWQHLDCLATVTDSTSYNLVFYWRNDASIGTQPGAVIDNITIETYTCTSPAAIHASSPTANSTTLTWTPGVSDSQWQVQVLEGANVILDTVVATPTLPLNNLTGNTAYTARVRGLCSVTSFGWWTSIQFATACDDIRSLPYTENFQSYGTGTSAKPNCWTYTQQYSTYPYVTSSAYNHTPGAGSTGAMYFYATSTASNCVALPRLSIPGKTIQDMQMSFFLLITTLNYNMTVGVMTDPTDFSTFVPVKTCSADAVSTTTNQNWKYIEVDFSEYTGNGQYIAFYDGTRGAINSFYLDDIEISLIPTCPRPKDAEVIRTNENSATIAFTTLASGATHQAIAVGRGNVISAANIVATATSTNDTITLRGLSAETNYDCYIRSICGAGDTSVWSIVVPFSTTAVPETLPLVTDFSNAADNAKWVLENGTQINKWYIGTATGNGDSHALFVSENGTNTNYTITTACYDYAYRLVRFTPGIYQISFDWTGGGEGTYDFIRAFLVPSNETFTAGSTGKLSAATTVPDGWISLNGLKGYFNDPTATSNTWKSVEETVSFTDTTNMYILFYWKNDASSGTQPAGAVDNVSIQPLSCASTFSIDKSDVDAVFTFTPSMGTPTGYEIVVDNQPISFSNLNGVLYHTITTSTVDTVSNLVGNTQYYSFVRTICGNDTGRWITADFRTECTLLVPPVFLDLEDNTTTGTGSTPNCWTHISGGNFPYVYNNRSMTGGTKCLYFYQSSTATTEPNMVAMPKLNVPNIQDYRIEFYTMYASAISYGLIVGVMEDLANLSTFVPVDTVWTTQNNVWEQQVVHFRNYTGNGKYIVFRTDYGLRSAADYINVDNFTIVEDRMCQTPTNLSVANLTGNGATLIWNSGNGLTYDIIMATSEVNPDTVTTAGGDVMIYENDWTTNSLDLSGMLQTNHTYWFYVQADCQSADNKPSLWSEGYQFTTVCPAYALPYSQDFVTSRPNTTAMPACWQTLLEVTGTPTGSPTQIVDPYIYGGGNCYQKSATDSCSLRMGCYYSATATSKSIAILPEFTGSYAGYKLSFYTACTANADGVIGGALLVGTMTDVSDASTFETIDTVFNNNFWNYHAVALDGVTNTAGKRLALLWDGDMNQKSGFYYIDNLAIEPYTTCEAPVNPHANVNGGSADIFVSTVSPADSLVHIELLRESTLVKDTIMNVANLPWHVNGLDGLTTYGIHARVLCNRAAGTYSNYNYRIVEFTTGCAPVALPYSYNFDSETQTGSGNRPTHCWTGFQSNGAASYPYVYTTYSSSAPYSLYLYGTSSYSSVAVLPELNVTSMQNVVMSFMARKSTSTYDVQVGVMTDPEDLTTFTPVATVTPTSLNAFQEVNVSFANYTGTGRYIAFVCGGTKTSTLMIDDIFVEYEPTCHRPSIPTFVTNTPSSITASWTASVDGETQWDVTALPVGRRPDANTTYTTVSTTTATVAGLQPNTSYDFFVRAACSSTDHSSWSNASMRTACVPFNITDSTSFFEEFDSDGTGSTAHPSCWTTLTNSTTAYPYINTTHNSGVGSLYFYATSTNYSYAVTTELTGTPIQQLELNFMGRTTNLTYYIEVGVMTDPYDISTFTLMSTITPEATSVWEPKRVRFSSYTGTGRYIAFRIPPKATTSYNVDDVEISALGACASPDAHFNEINSDSVDIEIFPIFPTDSVWQIVVTPPASTPAPDMNSAVINRTVTHTHDTITGFPYNTAYTLYVRTVCGAATTQWSVYNVKTPCGPLVIDDTHPYLELFDNYGTGAGHTPDCWFPVTTGATIPYCSTSQHQSGAASLYFYNSTGNTTTAATPRIEGTPVRELEMNFKLRQTTAYVIEVGVMEDPLDQSTFFSCASFKAASTTAWNDITVRFASYTGNAKYIAFRSTGITTTSYIDNVQISVVPPCSGPGLSYESYAYDDVRLSMIGSNPADTIFEYIITPTSTATSPNMSNVVARDTVGNGVHTLTTLPAGNSLTVYARSLCGTEWTMLDIKVPCLPVLIDDSHSLSDDFDNYGTTLYVSFPNCWSRGTNATSQYPYVNSTHNSGVGSMYFYGNATYYSYAATPQLIGTPINQLRLEFAGRKTSAAYYLEIGAMTDPNDYSTFVPIDTVTCLANSSWENFVVDLLGYTGNAQYVAFRIPQGAANGFYIDDLVISKIPGCSFPGITVSFSNGTADIEILPAKPQDAEWEIVVNQSSLDNDTTGSIFRQTVTSTNVVVPNLSYASTYFIHARSHCSATEWSEWGVTPFTTPCGVVTLPYTEQFAVVPPSCWSLRTGLIDNVMNGTETMGTNTGIWLANNTGNGLQGTHVKVNNYGTTRKHWLITPDIFIDTTAVLKFDMALTDYGNGNVVDNFGNQPDDRFVVAVSRDGGETWNRTDLLAEWNNTGSSHVYDNIATTGETVELSLNSFIGDTVKIGFYVESTVTNGDNDFHLGNVNVIVIRNIVDLTDNVCDGYNYTANGFNLSSSDIVLGGQNLFSRISADTMYRLTLNVTPSVEIEFNDTVCSGNLPYTLHGFNVTTGGTHQRFLSTAAGCDSIVTLNLVVNQGFTDSETVTICASALPYLWNGQSLTAAGTYTHTVAAPNGCDSVFTLNLVVTQAITSSVSDAICQGQTYTWNGQSYSTAGDYTWTGTALNGCDSIVTLHLTVNPVHYESIQLTIEQEETPYEWNGFSIDTTGSYTWYGQTAAGCDSVVTLDLYVRCVGLDYAEDGMFAISPNPVQRGGNVRLDVSLNEAERDGMVVEVFTSNGKLVNRFEPKEQPMFIKMPDIDGLYMVRLTTGTGRVLYGKVIVK